MEDRLSVIIVGGSIGGLSCAHALLHAGCDVTILERAKGKVVSAGAGLGIDRDSASALKSWGIEINVATLPLPREEVRAVNKETMQTLTLYTDDNYNHRAAHWGDLHGLLMEKLPPGILYYDHEVVSFDKPNNRDNRVQVTARVGGKDGELRSFEGDVMVAADGSASLTRKKFRADEQQRSWSCTLTSSYCGYCAWRGVLEYEAEPEITEKLKKEYPSLGTCLYFDLAPGTHAVLYELSGKRLNWLWYVNQPEPNREGHSATIRATEEQIREMREAAASTWGPELARLLQQTPAPFMNAIYDRDPIDQFKYGRVVLLGEAAHPTSPHGLRSTNMSIIDAHVLGECVAKLVTGKRSHEAGAGTDGGRPGAGGGDNAGEAEYGKDGGVDAALEEYQKIRVPVTKQQVLFSRHLGRLKQGLASDQPGDYPWLQADRQLIESLGQVNMSTFKC
eukprot:jgi/Mesen1/10410/ME000081S09792